MSIRRNKFPDAAAAAVACARDILGELEKGIAGKDIATLAVSGGSSPIPMFQEMAKRPFNWSQVHLFRVDERAVPPTDPQSNYRLAEEHFIAPAHFPRRNVHRVLTEMRPEDAARRYVAEIREVFEISDGELPHFDVIHRGMGPDAHTASLFPGEPLIDDRQGIAAAVWVEKMKQFRITLLPAALLSAHHTVVLASGDDKAEAVRNVFEEPYNPKQYPSQLGFRDGRGMSWFLDEGAAKLID